MFLGYKNILVLGILSLPWTTPGTQHITLLLQISGQKTISHYPVQFLLISIF